MQRKLERVNHGLSCNCNRMRETVVIDGVEIVSEYTVDEEHGNELSEETWRMILSQINAKKTEVSAGK
ncbi:hypothetical protein Hs20B_16450 [Lactococcus insecticola]|uniref:Uncharacterized protein n=1 Tax=Pseudolactococcus insecticola TaxID=2709158 RepID=A0A6A0BBN4_9LACT|nr:hypothetical protein Hs20B_16450 [Lactococcus insecticola]